MQQLASRPYTPGPREQLRRLSRLVSGYYQVHAHLPGACPMPLALENLLAAAQLPCGQPHPEEQSCPDCNRLLAETIVAICSQEHLCIWPILTEAIAAIEAGPPASSITHGGSATRRAAALLPRLADYHGVLHGPCERCGSQLWAKVPGGYRCLICAPPLRFPHALRTAILETCR